MNAILEIYRDCGFALFNENNIKTNNGGYVRLEDIPDELDINQDPKTIQKIFDSETALANNLRKNSGTRAVKGGKSEKTRKEKSQAKKAQLNSKKQENDAREHTR